MISACLSISIVLIYLCSCDPEEGASVLITAIVAVLHAVASLENLDTLTGGAGELMVKLANGQGKVPCLILGSIAPWEDY